MEYFQIKSTTKTSLKNKKDKNVADNRKRASEKEQYFSDKYDIKNVRVSFLGIINTKHLWFFGLKHIKSDGESYNENPTCDSEDIKHKDLKNLELNSCLSFDTSDVIGGILL